jgi:membrane protein YdbS with pleckstrin-like domain
MLYENLNVNPEDLPDVFVSEFNSHPKRYFKLRIISTIIFLLIPWAGIISIWIAGNHTFAYACAGLWLLIFAWAIFAETKSFPKRGYLLREKDVSYKKGWIFSSTTTIPFNRIQHSELSQGPISRMMKLSTLNIFTAGGSASDLSISGLDPQEAERLREWITEKISKHV